ncbi:unnamed protein product [Rotaria sp. Silwood2]|nr:unnamed protein product [Rotaria sp. Silwood2]
MITDNCILGYYIQSKMNSYVLDIYNSSVEPGTPVAVYPMKNRTSGDPSSQLWFFDQDRTIRNMATGMNMGANQQWKLDGLYVLCPSANKVIDIKNHNTVPGARVMAWSNYGGFNQQWNITPNFR